MDLSVDQVVKKDSVPTLKSKNTPFKNRNKSQPERNPPKKMTIPIPDIKRGAHLIPSGEKNSFCPARKIYNAEKSFCPARKIYSKYFLDCGLQGLPLLDQPNKHSFPRTPVDIQNHKPILKSTAVDKDDNLLLCIGVSQTPPSPNITNLNIGNNPPITQVGYSDNFNNKPNNLKHDISKLPFNIKPINIYIYMYK